MPHRASGIEIRGACTQAERPAVKATGRAHQKSVGGAADACASGFFGFSATRASVVTRSEAIEAPSCTAVRRTFTFTIYHHPRSLHITIQEAFVDPDQLLGSSALASHILSAVRTRVPSSFECERGMRFPAWDGTSCPKCGCWGFCDGRTPTARRRRTRFDLRASMRLISLKREHRIR
jgi:hypothetical protein